MTTMMRVPDIRKSFIRRLDNEEFTTDKTGMQTIEIIGASFIADEPAIFGTVNEKYVEQEIDWYQSMSTNIYDIRKDGSAPDAWKYAADPHGEIHSNYGYLIYSDRYYNQFEKALDELCRNPDSRRANMIYTRPEIWTEFDENGKSDFICTNAVCYYIRDGKMHAVVQMRSNDVVFGYKNDRAWAKYVLDNLVSDYNWKNPRGDTVTAGDIYWQVQNLHVYSRHFHLVGE